MFLFFKLALSLIAFFIRVGNRYLGMPIFGVQMHAEGVTLNVATKANKHKVYATKFGIYFKSRSIFKITRESTWDGVFKEIGLANEIQTGDQSFDSTFYIASDCSAFRQEITSDAESRKLIQALFKDGCESITCDGTNLLIQFSGDRKKDHALAVLSAKLYKQISDLDQHWKGFFTDPFAWKALFVEALVWSLATYAAVGYFEWMVFTQDLHLSPFLIAKHGLIVGVCLAAILLTFVILLMRGSSRGHRIIIESLVVLGISIPMGGIHFVSDVNVAFDNSEPYVIQTTVTSLYKQRHRRKRGTYYTYHMHIDPSATTMELDVPQHIQIFSSDFSRLTVGGRVEILIGQGYLKYPWFMSINPITP